MDERPKPAKQVMAELVKGIGGEDLWEELWAATATMHAFGCFGMHSDVATPEAEKVAARKNFEMVWQKLKEKDTQGVFFT